MGLSFSLLTTAALVLSPFLSSFFLSLLSQAAKKVPLPSGEPSYTKPASEQQAFQQGSKVERKTWERRMRGESRVKRA